mmetsp:Transcript_26704/g.42811  ORF Transcript_26704/g.42811 Transcript_26704/m.42811 type:complete len:110 (-) Transcript_26704:22-351(-)
MSVASFSLFATQLSSYLCTSRSSDLVLLAAGAGIAGFGLGRCTTALFFSATLRQGAASLVVLLLTVVGFQVTKAAKVISEAGKLVLTSSGVAEFCFRRRRGLPSCLILG